MFKISIRVWQGHRACARERVGSLLGAFKQTYGERFQGRRRASTAVAPPKGRRGSRAEGQKGGEGKGEAGRRAETAMAGGSKLEQSLGESPYLRC